MFSQFQVLSAFIAFTAVAQGATVPLDVRDDNPGVGWVRDICPKVQVDFCSVIARASNKVGGGCVQLTQSKTSQAVVYSVCLESGDCPCPEARGVNQQIYGTLTAP
ncbi:hypothetical protein PTT_15658 [Pyrenophora teres f. teres 0-1]|uniref:Uncharacterized protein n=2 Tax=Pyrenophora teres f. teres TaxID=97479 RepID=E3S0P5_PYRTT|nr:hypothetical protein PTT_15658 [Pyrenophora teres f. teres 0-1]